ncbi:uncharacterized protein CEXT_450191 [Caerostris extrusa]|uniref:Uncharacterized protein n=1 Tax=Caerostris extrusa TaxID=172846 RepID=A0AAV4XS66_CAEEX|nr:uncharacterized protein CEXT_450191 [Caerostris extrusa]
MKYCVPERVFRVPSIANILQHLRFKREKIKNSLVIHKKQVSCQNNRPNGLVQVEINNEENSNRSKMEEDVKIVPNTPKSERKKESADDDEKSLEWHLKDCLEKLAIYDAVWILSKEETFHQVFFPCEGPGMECDFVLQSIQNRGIGEKGLSTVGIMPCDVFYRDYGEDDEVQEDSEKRKR